MTLLRFYQTLLILSLSSTLQAQDKARAEVLRLQTQYENAVDRQVAPMREKYLGELKRLKESYTKAGDLDSALVVDTEMKVEAGKMGAAKPSLPDNETELKELLLKSTWLVMSSTQTCNFGPDGKIVMSSNGGNTTYSVTYKVTGRRKLTMFWGEGEKSPIECVISEDCLAIAEKSGAHVVWTRVLE